MQQLKWDQPDVILVTGDTYIDNPYIGVAVIGRTLMKHGFKTAIIAQPDTESDGDITRLGEPRLFWGVTAGSIDSMVANYTATKKFRRQDDYTPGGVNIRPDRATITYTNLIRRFFKGTKPIVLGGLEASLRRIAHYDYWKDSVRRSVLFDAKADILIFGMAEKTVLQLAVALESGAHWKQLPGLCYISKTPKENFRDLPAFEAVVTDKPAFMKMTRIFHQQNAVNGCGMQQKHGDRYLIHNPPHPPLTTPELDEIHALDFQWDAHPYYKTGEIRALKTLKQSLISHRGCFGQCRFCAITVHQGRAVVSRSRESLIAEARSMSEKPKFNGIIYDVGGPTANMYGATCKKSWICNRPHCLMPSPCPNLEMGHSRQISLLSKLRGIPGIKRVFITSGIRHDMILSDSSHGNKYIDQLVKHHVSGQIKLAPEHGEQSVLTLMNKPGIDQMLKFRHRFKSACAKFKKQFFITYYFIAAHPGCQQSHMEHLRELLQQRSLSLPEQVQVFTPTPSTLSTAMYYCETDLKGNRIPVEKGLREKQRQKSEIVKPGRDNRY